MVQVPPPPHGVAIVDPRTGHLTQAGFDFFERLLRRAGGAGDQTIVAINPPAASTDNAVARFHGTTGSQLQDSQVLVDDAGNVTVPGTVDGRDVSVDGTKLDGIEAGAEVNDVDSVFGRTGAVVALRGDYDGGQITGGLQVFQATVDQADLASAGTAVLLDAQAGEQWRVREIILSGAGTNFSGGGGDRDISVTDGTSTWTVIPAATLQALAASRWGLGTAVPFPVTAAHLTAASAAGTDIVAQYSGGTADYTAGRLTLVLIAERIA